MPNRTWHDYSTARSTAEFAIATLIEHVYMDSMAQSRQRDLVFRTWGGKRAGAGRKRVAARPQVPHRRRRDVHARHPVLVTTRVVPEVGRLRTEVARRAIEEAMAVAMKRGYADFLFRICQISIQGTHLHLLVETSGKEALSRGMQGFLVSCAKRLNAVARRSGRVFADRYHATALTTPRRVRAALQYVLGNWRKHGKDRGDQRRLDPMSSAASLTDWWVAPSLPVGSAHLMPVWLPSTWLLREGWRRAGTISPWARPGPA
jgi:REP element-mobilizing transposase RayT